MQPSEIAQLEAQIPLYEGCWLLAADIPAEHYQAFWTFTGAQTLTRCPDGKSRLPLSAWSEYAEWLSEPGNSPAAVAGDSKFEWRRRHGRWI